MRIPPLLRVLSLILPAAVVSSGQTLPEYEEFSPEWFYEMGFVDVRPSIAKRGMERFFQRDWDGAAGLVVGTGVRVSDQKLAQGAVELARGADFLVDARVDSARAALARCAEYAATASDLAEDTPQLLRSSVLRARCLALLPDRAGAARVLAGATKGMDDPADIAE